MDARRRLAGDGTDAERTHKAAQGVAAGAGGEGEGVNRNTPKLVRESPCAVKGGSQRRGEVTDDGSFGHNCLSALCTVVALLTIGNIDRRVQTPRGSCGARDIPWSLVLFLVALSPDARCQAVYAPWPLWQTAAGGHLDRDGAHRLAYAVARSRLEDLRPQCSVAAGASQSRHLCELPTFGGVLCGMEQSDRSHILMDAFGKCEPKRRAAAGPASEACWLDEQQWLAGLPAGSCETVIWGWWQPK